MASHGPLFALTLPQLVEHLPAVRFCIALLHNMFVVLSRHFRDEFHWMVHDATVRHACACLCMRECAPPKPGNQRFSQNISTFPTQSMAAAVGPRVCTGSHGFERGRTCVVAKGPPLGELRVGRNHAHSDCMS